MLRSLISLATTIAVFAASVTSYADDGPTVHIAGGDGTVAVERLVSRRRGWGVGPQGPVPHTTKTYAVMCYAPCDRVLPSGEGYRLAGGEIGSTRTFALSGTGTKHILIDPGDRTARAASLAVALGLVAAGSASAIYGWRTYDADEKPRTTFTVIGIGLLVTSVVFFVLAAKNGRTITVDGVQIAKRKTPLAVTEAGIAF